MVAVPRLGWSVAMMLATLVLAPTLATAAGLSEAERRGKRIYAEGEGRAPITAYLRGPGLEVPATAIPCVGCHMRDGAGQREGGVQSADITYTTLSKPFKGVRPSRRAHPPYDENGLAQAVLAALDPGGNALHEAHPRYDMEHEDLEDLIAYLKVLGREPVPGVTESEIRVGILLPDRGPLAEAGAEVRALLAGYFAEVNARGGLFRRALTLVPLSFDPARPDAAAAAARGAVEAEDVFCFLANAGVHPDDEAARVLAAARVPVIAPLGIAPSAGFGTDPYTFHIYASISDQARVMVDFLAEPRPTPVSRAALLYSEDPSGESGARGARKQLEKRGIALVEAVSFPPRRIPAPDAVTRLKAAGPEAVLLFGGPADLLTFLREAGRRGWRPLVAAPASMVGTSPLRLGPDLAESVYLAAPVARPDPASREMAELRGLIRKYSVPGRHRSFQLLAYAGARLLEEGLKRSGRRVARDRLVKTIEGLWAFRTGVTPPLYYDENRRVGAIGAAILRVDASQKRLIQAAPWREPR